MTLKAVAKNNSHYFDRRDLWLVDEVAEFYSAWYVPLLTLDSAAHLLWLRARRVLLDRSNLASMGERCWTVPAFSPSSNPLISFIFWLGLPFDHLPSSFLLSLCRHWRRPSHSPLAFTAAPNLLAHSPSISLSLPISFCHCRHASVSFSCISLAQSYTREK